MPVTIRKKKGGKYEVRTPNKVHSKGTSLKNAKAQKKIIDAADHGHPFTKKKKRRA